MAKNILFQLQEREMGFLRRVHDVIPRDRRETRGGIWDICPPEIFKTVHSNFDIFAETLK